MNEDLEVPLSHFPGEPFQLQFTVQANGYPVYRGDISTQLRFTGLPAGYSITSCYGFHADGATPVGRSTWGAVKARYR